MTSVGPKPMSRTTAILYDMQTPLLAISKAMRCKRCGARRGCCWPEPHNA
jgi:hypothetical protein